MKPKFILPILMVLWSTATLSQDTVHYGEEYLKVYPFYQKVTVSGTYFVTTGKEKDIFPPLGQIEDGKYIQFIKADRYTSKYRLKGRNINKLDNGEIPFATFEVKNGELNGLATMLTSTGDTSSCGNYRNNLRDSIWWNSQNSTGYQTYKMGMLDGLSYEIESVSYGEPYIMTKETTTNYKEDRILSRTVVQQYPEGQIREETVLNYWNSSYDKRYDYKEYEDSVLSVEGQFSSIGTKDKPVGRWIRYYTKNGQIKSDQNVRKNISTGDLFLFWAEYLSKDGEDFLTTRPLGVFEDNHSSGEGAEFNFYDFDPAKDYEINLTGSHFYPNGQKIININVVGGNIQIDTLFRQNGTARFYATIDEAKEQFVAYYFDENGKLKREKRLPLDHYQRKVDYIFYADKKLVKHRKYGNYTYFADLNSKAIEEDSATIVYLEIVHNGADLIHEKYFDKTLNGKYTFDNFAIEREEESPYTSTILEQYSPDFTSSTVTITTTIDSSFQVNTQFDVIYNPLHAYDTVYYNGFDVEKTIDDFWDGYTHRNHYSVRPKNYVESWIDIRNLESEYNLDGELLEGRVEIRPSDRYAIIRRRNETLIFMTPAKHEVKEEFYATVDRFGMRRSVNSVNFLPDLYYHIPRLENERFSPFDIYGASNFNAPSDASIYKGYFTKGKLDGDWKVENYLYVLLRAKFDHGLPTGTAAYYPRKYLRRYRYKGQELSFSNKQLSSVVFLDGRKRVLADLKYENNLPSTFKSFDYMFRRDKNPSEIKYGSLHNGRLLTVGSQNLYLNEDKHEFHLQDEFIAGEIDFLGFKGTVKSHLFTGVKTSDAGQGKTLKEHVLQGRIYSSEVTNSSGILVKSTQNDTSDQDFWLDMTEIYEFYPWLEFPWKARKYEDFHYRAREQDQKGFWVNGEPRYAGKIRLNGGYRSMDRRIGEWSYFDSEGTLLQTVTYHDNYYSAKKFTVDSIEFKKEAELVQYDMGKKTYEAIVVNIALEYDCDNDVYHELRTLYVTNEFTQDGTAIPTPSRYFETYYDNGVLQSEGELVNGMPHGLWKFYDFEGGLLKIGKYHHGIRDGRWLVGDLSGIGFIGDFCMNPDAYEFNPDAAEELKKDVEVSIIIFDKGKQLSRNKLQAFLGND